MAATATIAVNPATVQINQKVTANVTFTSDALDTSAVTVVSMKPHAIFTGATEPMPTAVAYGQPNLEASNPAIVVPPAGGSTMIPFDLTFFAPSTGLLSLGSGTYDVTVYAQLSDGTVLAPTAATVTVNNLPFPAAQQ